jgi:hypothetical protein
MEIEVGWAAIYVVTAAGGGPPFEITGGPQEKNSLVSRERSTVNLSRERPHHLDHNNNHWRHNCRNGA